MVERAWCGTRLARDTSTMGKGRTARAAGAGGNQIGARRSERSHACEVPASGLTRAAVSSM
jgi:hypothetical protein